MVHEEDLAASALSESITGVFVRAVAYEAARLVSAFLEKSTTVGAADMR
jgi:hypothetical protein